MLAIRSIEGLVNQSSTAKPLLREQEFTPQVQPTKPRHSEHNFSKLDSRDDFNAKRRHENGPPWIPPRTSAVVCNVDGLLAHAKVE